MAEQSMGLVDSEKYTDGEPGSMSFDKLDKLTPSPFPSDIVARVQLDIKGRLGLAIPADSLHYIARPLRRARHSARCDVPYRGPPVLRRSWQFQDAYQSSQW